jgi:hypothetical protein
MSDMGQPLVTRTAQDQILALDDDGRDAVDAAIEHLSEVSGELIDLPTAPQGTTYLAMKTSGGDTPVVIYRAASEREGGGWVILSLMSPDEYKDVLQLREFLAWQPGTRTLIEITAEALKSSYPWAPVVLRLREERAWQQGVEYGRTLRETRDRRWPEGDTVEAKPVTSPYRLALPDMSTRRPEGETAEAEDEAHRGS